MSPTLSTPTSPQDTSSRASSRSTTRRVDAPKPSKSRTRQFLASVSRSRSRPGTPDLTSGLQEEELPRRSQSHDAMVTLAKMPSMASMTSDMSSTRPSTRESYYNAHEWRQDRAPNLARTLLHKSSRLLKQKKSSSRLRSPDVEDSESGFGSIGESKSPRLPPPPQRPVDTLKHTISDPYNFQHLTHTSPTEAKSLQTANNQDLAVEFSNIRAAQAPHGELKGIRADSIQKQTEPFPPAASPSSPATDVESATASGTTSRPTSRPSSPNGKSQAPSSDSALRVSKSVDSFTRPAAFRSFSTPTPPIAPPPRKSSRRPMPLASLAPFHPQASLESPILPTHNTDTSRTRASPRATFVPPPPRSPGFYHKASPAEEIATAVSTPDDSAYVMQSHSKIPVPTPPPVTTPQPLDQVPEEEGSSTSATSSPKAAKRPENLNISTIRHMKSMPSTRHFSRIFPAGNAAAAESGMASPGLGPPPPPTHGMTRRISRRVSHVNGRVEIIESWEDGVDFCYEHAMDELDELDEAEAWLEKEQAGSDSDTTPPAYPVAPITIPPLATVDADDDPFINTPDLQAESTKSAASSSVTVPGIVTPAEPSPQPQILTVPRDASGSAAFTLSPSLLIPKEYTSAPPSAGRLTHEDTSYHYALTAVNGLEHKFVSGANGEGKPYTFYAGLGLDTAGYAYQNNSNSGNNNGMKVSKQTSNESLPAGSSLNISTAAIDASRHRLSSSVGSVPELIGSKTPTSPNHSATPSTSGASTSGTSIAYTSTTSTTTTATTTTLPTANHTPTPSSTSTSTTIAAAAAKLRASPERLDVDALRRDFLLAAEQVPIADLEAATPPPGTPVKTSFGGLGGAFFGERLGRAREQAARDALVNRAGAASARSRSNSDSAGRLLNGGGGGKAGAPPTPTLHPEKNGVGLGLGLGLGSSGGAGGNAGVVGVGAGARPLGDIGKPSAALGMRHQHRLRASSVANAGMTHKSKASLAGYSLFPSPTMGAK